MDSQNEIRLFDRNAVAGISGQWSLLFVCVDKLDPEGEAAGRLYNCYQQESYPFHGYANLLLAANDLIDRLGLPQSQTKIRSLWPQPRAQALAETPAPQQYYALHELLRQRGALYDVCIYIFSRQNASWQGLLTLPNRTETQAFRSALELLYLLREYQEMNTQSRLKVAR